MSSKPRPAAQDPDTELLAQALYEISRQLAALAASNERIEGLLRIMAEPVLQSALTRYFKNSAQIRAYELSDGILSTRQIGKMVGVDQKTISTWWRHWEGQHGIVERAGKRGQFRRRFSFVELLGMSAGAPSAKPRAAQASVDSGAQTEPASGQIELLGL